MTCATLCITIVTALPSKHYTNRNLRAIHLHVFPFQWLLIARMNTSAWTHTTLALNLFTLLTSVECIVVSSPLKHCVPTSAWHKISHIHTHPHRNYRDSGSHLRSDWGAMVQSRGASSQNVIAIGQIAFCASACACACVRMSTKYATTKYGLLWGVGLSHTHMGTHER